jgi:hypothetical protein
MSIYFADKDIGGLMRVHRRYSIPIILPNWGLSATGHWG